MSVIRRISLVVGCAACLCSVASGETLDCVVDRKLDTENVYTEEHLARFEPIVRLITITDQPLVQRCSFSPTANRQTCDTYTIDYWTEDSVTRHRKFYYFRGQFDLQVFSSGRFIENNGRGAISFGNCELE